MTGQIPHAEQPAPARTVGNSRVLDAIQSLGLLGVILIGGLLLSFASPVFFSRINIENLLFASTIIAVVAMGQAFVILVAGIDLAVGAVLALLRCWGWCWRPRQACRSVWRRCWRWPPEPGSG